MYKGERLTPRVGREEESDGAPAVAIATVIAIADRDVPPPECDTGRAADRRSVVAESASERDAPC